MGGEGVSERIFVYERQRQGDQDLKICLQTSSSIPATARHIGRQRASGQLR